MAGLKAMASFRTASRMENQLALIAQSNDIPPPYSADQIKIIMSKTPRKFMDDIQDSSMDLYEIMNDPKLVDKIISIVNNLLIKMSNKPKVYSEQEIIGIELGRDIITGSKQLFYQFEKDQRSTLVYLIQQIESDAITNIFESNES